MACHRWLCISLLLLLLLSLASQSCHALHSFGFDIHHRFSDPVKEILGVHDLPDKGTRQYYVAMAHRDRIFRGRRLAAAVHHSPLTFVPANETYQIGAFGLYEFVDNLQKISFFLFVFLVLLIFFYKDFVYIDLCKDGILFMFFGA